MSAPADAAARVRLERLLGGEALAGLRVRLRRRYERGLAARVFTLSGLLPVERRALEGLLGLPPRTGGSMRVSLDELDAALARAGLAPTLRDALAALDGPVAEVTAERARRAAAWEAVLAAALHPLLAALAGTGRGRGLLKRAAGGDPERGRALLEAAAEVLARLPVAGWPRSRLAAEVLHDAHGLDDGRPVAAIVLAALAQGGAASGGEARPRELWAAAGVLVNELAAPALSLNLPAHEATPGGRLLAAARVAGEPLHLSLRVLLRAPPRFEVAGRVVHVCENPAVVAMAADRLGPRCAPLLCTEGMPSAAQRTLLAQLAQAGALLRYHGDFDWPGITIGNFVMREFGARPWRFAAADYAPAAGRAPTGDPVPALWDPELAAKMQGRGRVLEEEAVIETLLADLGRDRDEQCAHRPAGSSQNRLDAGSS